MSSDILNILNTAVSPVFKRKYLDYLDSSENKEYPWLSKVKRVTDVTGNEQTKQLKFGTQGGYSAGSIGTAGLINYGQAEFKLKQLYVHGKIDCKSLELSSDKSGAAVKLTTDSILEANREVARNGERQCVYGNEIGTISTVTDNGGGDYSIVMTAADWVRTNFLDGQHNQFGTNQDSLFRVKLNGVTRSTRSVRYLRIQGAYVPAPGDKVYMEGGYNASFAGGNEMLSLHEVISASSGTYYNRSIGPGWQSEQYAAGGDAIGKEMLLDVAYNILHETASSPTDLLSPLTQYKKLVHLGEASLLDVRMKEGKAGRLDIGSIPHMYLDGMEIPITRLLTMRAAEVMFIKNKADYLCMYSAGEGKFVENGGSMFFNRHQFGHDEVEYFWRKYCEQFIHPQHHGIISGLSTTTVA